MLAGRGNSQDRGVSGATAGPLLLDEVGDPGAALWEEYDGPLLQPKYREVEPGKSELVADHFDAHTNESDVLELGIAGDTGSMMMRSIVAHLFPNLYTQPPLEQEGVSTRLTLPSPRFHRHQGISTPATTSTPLASWLDSGTARRPPPTMPDLGDHDGPAHADPLGWKENTSKFNSDRALLATSATTNSVRALSSTSVNLSLTCHQASW